MKKPRATQAQWEQARAAVADGVALARIAGLVGVQTRTVRAHARKEGWQACSTPQRDVGRQRVDGAASAAPEKPTAADAVRDPAESEADRPDMPAWAGCEDTSRPAEAGDPVEMLARTSRFVARQLARMIAAADRRGGRLDKAQIDGLAALSRVVERWEALAREQAMEKQKKDEADLASTLDRIDRRIIELARELADVLVAEQAGRREG